MRTAATPSGGGLRHALAKRFSAPLAIYGLMIYTVLVGVIADHAESTSEVFVGTVLTQLVFFAAHVFAHTLGEHGDLGLRQSLVLAVGHASALLYAAIPPAVVLGVGALVGAEPDGIVDLTLLVSTIILGILGYIAYARRTPNIAIRIAGALGTALLGAGVMIIEYLVH